MTFYIPAHFQVDDRETLERFIETHAFGTLVTAGPAGLGVSHIPFLPQSDADGRFRLLGHVARANAHAQELESAAELLVIFEGPHAYVSPGWYRNHPSVPTWNYAVVHARGKARLLPPGDLAPLLDRLSRTYEDKLPEPWRMQGLPPDFAARMVQAIVAFEITVDRLEGKFKLSQNRRREDVEGVIAALRSRGEGPLAQLMLAHAAGSTESR